MVSKKLGQMRWKETCLLIATSCFGWFDAQTKYDRYTDAKDEDGPAYCRQVLSFCSKKL